ncbi:hypothetical protein ARALYDRAFT_890706 [Arabidopsis lyrata subsp. lyrata]|uniref:F-box associated beta-propeller type 3 domain-containing protein n=1 Tax=Arabidopsis lyrata subsp. lyrata TaxID=81972 RepID=D7KGJ9_ARALL|nr:hypothetical protein ARALYDRAFT_890706 [Arabidopsis lyrata subsp. lyrata]
MPISPHWCLQNCCAVSGLIYCPNSPKSVDRLPVICKPSTGQQVSLPKAKKTKEFVHNFFGYDPILKQLKVMVMSRDKDVVSEWRPNVDGRLNLELTLWVLEDVKKAEFSKRVYNLPELWENRNVNASVSVAGVTSTGEIVLSMEYTSNPFYVFYYNLDSYTLHRVEIQGIEAFGSYRVRAFVDHVEDLKFLTSS